MLNSNELFNSRLILQDIKRATSPVGKLHFYYGALERDLEETNKYKN